MVNISVAAVLVDEQSQAKETVRYDSLTGQGNKYQFAFNSRLSSPKLLSNMAYSLYAMLTSQLSEFSRVPVLIFDHLIG